jgi:hypothetical protein
LVTSKLPFTVISHFGSRFDTLMKMDDIKFDDILNSLDLELNQKTVLKASESKGKSGSFFFSTHNKKFLIKTASNTEF